MERILIIMQMVCDLVLGERGVATPEIVAKRRLVVVMTSGK